MARTYDRETKHYDFAVLTHLVETGQATFFDGPGIYVIKTEDGTVAVRPHQVLFAPTEAPLAVVVADEPVAADPAPGTPVGKRSWVSAAEEDEILKHFGI